MNTKQLVTLIKLKEILDEATDNGLLDEMAAHSHPDTINTFCDAVTECFKAHEG